MNDFTRILSDELILAILSYLSLQELTLVSRVCLSIHRLSTDGQLWKYLYHEHYGASLYDPKSYSLDWKALFRLEWSWQSGACKAISLPLMPHHKGPRLKSTVSQHYISSDPCVCLFKDFIIYTQTEQHLPHPSLMSLHLPTLHQQTQSALSYSQGYVTCMTVDNSNVVMGYSTGEWSLFHISSRDRTLSLELILHTKSIQESPIVAMCLYKDMLCCMTMDFTLRVYHVTPLAKARLVYTARDQGSGVYPLCVTWLPSSTLLYKCCVTLAAPRRYGNVYAIQTLQLELDQHGCQSSRYETLMHDAPSPTYRISALLQDPPCIPISVIYHHSPYIYVAQYDHCIMVYDQDSLNPVTSLVQHCATVTALSVDSVHGRLVSCAADGIKIWRLPTASNQHEFKHVATLAHPIYNECPVAIIQCWIHPLYLVLLYETHSNDHVVENSTGTLIALQFIH